MKKAEILWMCNHRCNAHGVAYVSHPKCYEREKPDDTKIGLIDIKASNLKADFGVVIYYGIQDLK